MTNFRTAKYTGSSGNLGIDDPNATIGDGYLSPEQAAATQALVSRGGIARRLRGVQRMVGGSSIVTQTNTRTWCNKLEAEAPFDSVRLHLFSKEAGGATVFTGVVAATDIAPTSNSSLMFHPQVQGVEYQALRASVGAPGWAAVTWGGASSVDIPAGGTVDVPVHVSSDWIELPSIVRADSGTRPLLMSRIYHDIANGQFSTFGQLTADASADSTGWENESARPWWRVFQSGTTTTDSVTTLTQKPTALSNASIAIAFEFGYRVPALSVLGSGDSLTEAQTFSWGGYGTWGHRGCALASSAAKPITWIQNGHSGKTSAVYVAQAEVSVPRYLPSHVLYEPYSPNDQDVAGNISSADIARALARLQRMIRLCETYGAKLVCWSPMVSSNYNTADDANRLILRSQLAAMAAAGAFDWLDFETVVGDGATPARFKSGFSQDAVHMNNVAQDAMAEVLRAYLATQSA